MESLNLFGPSDVQHLVGHALPILGSGFRWLL